MKEPNKCEEMKIEHAWRQVQEMWGFSTQTTETCANCGLKRTHIYESKEWWSYSDDRPNEPIFHTRPV